jgi:hypothetical protein
MTPERRRLALRASTMALRIRQQYAIAPDLISTKTLFEQTISARLPSPRTPVKL